jgi:DNA-binding MarR family transcriptional regulator
MGDGHETAQRLKPARVSANLCVVSGGGRVAHAAHAQQGNTSMSTPAPTSSSDTSTPVSGEPLRPLVEQFAHVVRAYTSALQGVTLAAASHMGINITDHRCLELIERRGGLTAGQLAELSGLSTGAVTTVLDRLERAGYVRRVRDSNDRRRVLVEVTSEGRRMAEEIFAPLIAESRAMLNTYTDEQLAFLIEFLNHGRDLSLAHTARIRALGAAGTSASTPPHDE